MSKSPIAKSLRLHCLSMKPRLQREILKRGHQIRPQQAHDSYEAQSSHQHLRPLSTKTTGKLNVFGFCHKLVTVEKCGQAVRTDSNTLGMDGAEVGIFKKRDEVSFDGLLKSTDCRRLEAEVRFKVLSNFTDETLEGELSN